MHDIPPNISSGSRHGKRRGWKWLLLIPAVLLTGCAAPGIKNTSRSFRTVVIDAGHGGHDNGTRSRYAGSEKAAALDVALRLEPKLQAAGFRTVMTRRRDEFIELNERAWISNRQANAIFASIHFNESRSRRISGSEVYYKSAPSQEIAARVLRKLASLPGGSARGIKRSNFRVLRLNKYPAVLIECAYFSNPAEAKRCATAAHRERIAQALSAAIIEQREGR